MHELRKLSPYIDEASQVLLDYIDKNEVIRCVSHHDADGIAAAAIMTQTLLRLDAKFHLTCMRGLNTSILKNLNEEPYNIIVFTDMGSGSLHLIENTIYDKKIIILDHHPISKSTEKFLQINPHLEGIDGSKDISGAGITYLFSRTLGNNTDLAQIALIGAYGDMQLRKGARGLNKFIVDEAQNNGFIKEKKDIRLFGREKYTIDKALEYTFDPYLPGLSNNKEGVREFLDSLDIQVKGQNGYMKIPDLDYDAKKKITSELVLKLMREGLPAHTATRMIGPVYEILDLSYDLGSISDYTSLINACGRMNETSNGILICFNDKKAIDNSFSTWHEYKNEICNALDYIKNNIETRDSFTMVEGREKISPTLAGALSTISMLSSLVPDDKPFAMVTEAEDHYKISIRGNSSLIKRGINLGDIMYDICSEFGGNGGGHNVAAGANIPKERLNEFLDELNSKILNVDKNAA